MLAIARVENRCKEPGERITHRVALSFNVTIIADFPSRTMTKTRRRRNFLPNSEDCCGRRERLRRGKRLEQRAAVDAADERIDQVLRMRHDPEHVEPLVEDAGDAVLRAVRVRAFVDPAVGVAIPKRDLAPLLDRM